MVKKIIYLFFIFLFTYFFGTSQEVIAKCLDNQPPRDTTGQNPTQAFLNSICIDLPPAVVSCKTGGSLTQIFSSASKFKSGGNAFFVDKVNKEIALLESAVIDNIDGGEGKITADLFIKVPNVPRENLTALLLKHQIIASQNANVVFVVKVLKKDSQEVYIYDGQDENNNKINSTVYTQVRKLGMVKYNGEKFFTADGTVKIRFPLPPKKVDTSGNLVNIFDKSDGYILCTYKGSPIHDSDLTDLKDAFDGNLVKDITQEATKK